MLAKKIIAAILFVLSCLCAIKADALSIENRVEKGIIETLSKNTSQANTVVDLNGLLAKDLSSLAKQDLGTAEIITNVFVANKTADLQDALNATSTNLFKKALQEVKKLNRADLQLWVATQYGFYLYTYRKYEEVSELFIYSIRTLDQIAQEEIILPCETYKRLSFFLMTVQDYEKADEYLWKAKHYAAPNSADLAAITDVLGLNSINRNDLVKAEHFFKEALVLAANVKDELRYAKVLGNIASVKFKQKQYLIAIDLLKKDIAISQRLQNTQNTVFALAMLGKVHLAKGDVAEANEALQAAQVQAQSKVYLQSSAYEINTLILEIAQKTGNEKEELMARRKLDELNKTLGHSDGKEVITKVSWSMEKKNLQFSIMAEQAKRQAETLQKVIALAGCFVLALAIGFVVKRFQHKISTKKTEYDQTIHRLIQDKEKSERKLKVNSQTLESYRIYLKEKNEQIKELEVEMTKVNLSSPDAAEKYTDKMQTLLESHLMTNDIWTEFKQSFLLSYPAYYKHLSENFPGLTDSNLRIIFLSKLEMNNVEISRILGLTLEGVKKAKQRLRRKYEESYDELF